MRIPRSQRLHIYNELLGLTWIRKFQQQHPDAELLPSSLKVELPLIPNFPSSSSSTAIEPLPGHNDHKEEDVELNKFMQQQEKTLQQQQAVQDESEISGARYRFSYMFLCVHRENRVAKPKRDERGVALPDGRFCHKIVEKHMNGVLSKNVVRLTEINNNDMLADLTVNVDWQGDHWVHGESIRFWREDQIRQRQLAIANNQEDDEARAQLTAREKMLQDAI